MVVQEGHLLLYQEKKHTHKKMDRDVNAFQRIVGNQGGNEKAAGF